MRVIDLFAGAGGFSTGLRAAGHDIVGAVEFDKDAAATYRAMVGDHMIEQDICGVGAWQLPECDLIVGGPPCQGFSVAGKQDKNDPRNRLWYEFLRIVDGKRPAWVVIENVRGMLTAGEDKAVVTEFRKIGYDVSVYLLNTADFGVPQRRYRVFYIGNRVGAPNPVPQQTHAKPPGHIMFGFEPWVTVRQAFGGYGLDQASATMTTGGNRHGSPNNPKHGGIQHWIELPIEDDLQARVMDTPAMTIRASKKGPQGFSIERRHMAGYIPNDRPDDMPTSREFIDIDEPSSTITSKHGGDPIRHKGLLRTAVTHGRASLDEAAPTVKGGGVRDHTGKVNGPTPPPLMIDLDEGDHWLANDFGDAPRMGWRRLTVRETAILQDFPDWFEFTGSMTSQYRQIGNAVPPGMARAIGLALIDAPLTMVERDRRRPPVKRQ